MRNINILYLLIVLMSMVSIEAEAYDCEIDGIYYNLSYETQIAQVTSDGHSGSYSGDIVIPESVEYGDDVYSVTSIGNSAFYGCSDLTSIDIPNSVTEIDRSAFEGCSSLTSVAIPNSVTEIGYHAFANCTNLSSIIFPNSVTEIGSNAFDGTAWFDNQEEGLVYVGSIVYKYKGVMSPNTNITIKDETISIGSSAFSGCSGLTSVTIPESVTSIGSSAFYRCSGLTSPVYNSTCFVYMPTSYSGVYSIPNGITNICDYAFSGCSGLTSLIIPNSITSIGGWAFSGCSGLTSLIIPSSVTSIDYYAFENCTGLTSIKVEWNRPLAIDAEYKPFMGVDKINCTLYVPKGTAMMFMSAPGWLEFVNIVEYEDGEDVHHITIRMGDGGVLKQSVEVGKTYTYVVRADEGWEVSTLTFDGKDMTALLLDGQFSTPVITGNSELNVVFKQINTEVKAIPSVSDVKVYASNKSITVTGADENADVAVYGINGMFVTSAVGNTTIPLEHGVYIVKVGKETFKVGL